MISNSDLPNEYFDPKAPLNVPQRFLHKECSEGKDPCLIITKTFHPTYGLGWIYICHRCGIKGFKKAKELSRKEWIEFKKSLHIVKQNSSSNTITSPNDYTIQIPERGLAWLYKYDIKPEEIKEFRIGYSPSWQRVILPVYKFDRLIYYQARYVGFDSDIYNKRKYINIKAKRKDIYFSVIRFENQKEIIIVEDILSAIKVGRHKNTLALLGSYIPDDLILKVKLQGINVSIWLDYDKRISARKYTKRFNALGIKCKQICTPYDPKEYNDNDIKHILKEGRYGK